jgi:hypothetical protein
MWLKIGTGGGWALVNMVMNLWVPQKAGSDCTISFSIRTLLH